MADLDPTSKRPDPDKGNIGDKAKESFDKLTNRIGEKYEELKKHESLRNFSGSNTRDVIVYLCLLIGFIFSLFMPYLGHLIIGIIAGLYYGEDIAVAFSRMHEIIDGLGLFRFVILAFLGITLFIAVPMIFIGIAIGMAIKLFLLPKNSI